MEVHAVGKDFVVPDGAARLDVRRALPNPHAAIQRGELGESLGELEAWLRLDSKTSRKLDALVERGVQASGDALYVVCFGGKHRSQVVAALIRDRLAARAAVDATMLDG